MQKYKGEGKGGSLGMPVEEVVGCRAPCRTAGGYAALTYPTEKTRKYSAEEIEKRINGGYYTKENFARDIYYLQPGDHVLWQGVATGPKGGESTKELVYHGVFHEWIDWHHASVN